MAAGGRGPCGVAMGSLTASCLLVCPIAGRGPREDQGELRVPQVPDPAGRGPAAHHERDLPQRLQRQHPASQGGCPLVPDPRPPAPLGAHLPCHPTVHSPQHGQRPGTAQRHQRHPLHSSQVSPARSCGEAGFCVALFQINHPLSGLEFEKDSLWWIVQGIFCLVEGVHGFFFSCFPIFLFATVLAEQGQSCISPPHLLCVSNLPLRMHKEWPPAVFVGSCPMARPPGSAEPRRPRRPCPLLGAEVCQPGLRHHGLPAVCLSLPVSRPVCQLLWERTRGATCLSWR